MATVAPTQTPARPARKGIAHALEHRHLAEWIQDAEPHQERDRLIQAYVRAAEARTAAIRREPEIVAELKAVARVIAGDPGRKLEEHLRHQARLTAELAVIEDLRVEATRAYIAASRSLGKLLNHQITSDHDAVIAAINAYAPERDSLRRLINTLPKPDSYDEAKRRLSEIATELEPHYRRRDLCRQAYNEAKAMLIDRNKAAWMIQCARKGSA